jgi:hypothetical protein
MEAPKCKTCGERHWSRICPKFQKVSKEMKPATPLLIEMQATIDSLRAEVKQLKRELAKRGRKSHEVSKAGG